MRKGLLDWLLEDDIFEARFGLQKTQTGALQSTEDDAAPEEPLTLDDAGVTDTASDTTESPSIASVQPKTAASPLRWLLLTLLLILGLVTGALFAPVDLPEPAGSAMQKLRQLAGLTPPAPPAAAPAKTDTSPAAPAAVTPAMTAVSGETTAPTGLTADTTAVSEPVTAAATLPTRPATAAAATAPVAPQPVWYVLAGPYREDTPPPTVVDAGYGWSTTTDDIEQSGRQVATSRLSAEKADALLKALNDAGIPARIRRSATGISVIAGPFTSRDDADNAAIEMARQGAPASVSDARIRTRRFWARIGPIRDRASAEALAQRLRQPGIQVRIEEARETP